MTLEVMLIFVCLILFFLCCGLYSLWRGAEQRAEYYLELARKQNR